MSLLLEENQNWGPVSSRPTRYRHPLHPAHVCRAHGLGSGALERAAPPLVGFVRRAGVGAKRQWLCGTYRIVAWFMSDQFSFLERAWLTRNQLGMGLAGSTPTVRTSPKLNTA